MENQIRRRVVRQTALNQPPIKLAPEGGYHRGWKVTRPSHISDLQSMAEKNQAKKDLADQKVEAIVKAWEAQEFAPQLINSKWGAARQLADFSRSIDKYLSPNSLAKRYRLWSHLHGEQSVSVNSIGYQD